MLSRLIAAEPKEVRDKSYVEKDRIVIPTEKRKKDVYKVLKDKIKGKSFSNERLYYESLTVEKPKKKSISALLMQGGR